MPREKKRLWWSKRQQRAWVPETRTIFLTVAFDSTVTSVCFQDNSGPSTGFSVGFFCLVKSSPITPTPPGLNPLRQCASLTSPRKDRSGVD